MGLSRTVSEINVDFRRKSQIPLRVFNAPDEGVFLGIGYRRSGSKTRMMGLPGRERSLTISSASGYTTPTWRTEGQTDTGRQQRPRLYITVSVGKNGHLFTCWLTPRKSVDFNIYWHTISRRNLTLEKYKLAQSSPTKCSRTTLRSANMWLFNNIQLSFRLNCFLFNNFHSIHRFETVNYGPSLAYVTVKRFKWPHSARDATTTLSSETDHSHSSLRMNNWSNSGIQSLCTLNTHNNVG